LAQSLDSAARNDRVVYSYLMLGNVEHLAQGPFVEQQQQKEREGMKKEQSIRREDILGDIGIQISEWYTRRA
jgi:hypothetical protein